MPKLHNSVSVHSMLIALYIPHLQSSKHRSKTAFEQWHCVHVARAFPQISLTLHPQISLAQVIDIITIVTIRHQLFVSPLQLSSVQNPSILIGG